MICGYSGKKKVYFSEWLNLFKHIWEASNYQKNEPRSKINMPSIEYSRPCFMLSLGHLKEENKLVASEKTEGKWRGELKPIALWWTPCLSNFWWELQQTRFYNGPNRSKREIFDSDLDKRNEACNFDEHEFEFGSISKLMELLGKLWLSRILSHGEKKRIFIQICRRKFKTFAWVVDWWNQACSFRPPEPRFWNMISLLLIAF